MRGRRRVIWLGALFVLATVSLIVDQNTGDTTGPPFHDSLLNQIAFFAFFGFAATFLLLAAFTLIAWIYGRIRGDKST